MVTLTSAERTTSATAAQCLRLIAGAERQKGNAPAHLISEEEKARRYPVYEQLGDPKAMVLGERCLFAPGFIMLTALKQVALLTRNEFVSSCGYWLSRRPRISLSGRNAIGGGEH